MSSRPTRSWQGRRVVVHRWRLSAVPLIYIMQAIMCGQYDLSKETDLRLSAYSLHIQGAAKMYLDDESCKLPEIKRNTWFVCINLTLLKMKLVNLCRNGNLRFLWIANQQCRAFLSRVSTLTRDIDIAFLYVCLSVCPSVRNAPVSDENGLTYCHSFFSP